jgi:hypothetical protein
VSRADWTRAREVVPYAEDGAWVDLLSSNPEALYRIIADSYDFVLREREVLEGKRRPGRRPRPSQVPIDEVIDAVFPKQYSNEPFVEALASLVDGRSQRAFSAEVPCNQATLSRLLSGQAKPDMAMMEGLARAGGVPPWYFREWRAEYLASLIREVMLESPSMSVQALRALQLKARA